MAEAGAAEHGSAGARGGLGVRYMTADGVRTDAAEGIKWLRKAAEAGITTAQNDLGYALMITQPTKADLMEACMWLELANKEKLPAAMANLTRVISRLTPEEYVEAKKKAAAFRPDPGVEPDPMKQ